MERRKNLDPSMKGHASTAADPGSGNQETYKLHLLLIEDANRSMSKGPKNLATRRKAGSDKDHSVSGSAILDSASATEFSKDDI